jgi:phage-related tail protein
MRNHTTIRTALAALAVAVAAPAVAAGAQAGAAQAPEVGAQKTLTAGKVAPVTIPGTGLKKGMKLKSGQKLVFRAIALGDSKTVRFTLSCGTAG